MKIAVFHELNEGGARRAVNEISKRFKLNHIVDLYIVDENYKTDEDKFYTNIFLQKFKLKKRSGKNPAIRLYKDTIELIKLYVLHKKLAKKIDSKNYDFIFVHPSKYTQAPFILRFLKTKKIYYCEETLRIVYESELGIEKNISLIKRKYEQINRKVRKGLDKKNISSADFIIANSDFTKKNIYKAYGLKSTVSYLGVNVNFFKTTSLSKENDILYIGSTDESDGFDLLHEAILKMSKKPSVKYHIVGKNWVSDNELRKMYQKSKIAVCLYKNEPFGLIPLEAMACGAVVVALDQGGYRETIKNGKTGYLINNSKELKEKIEYLLSNSKVLEEFSKKAYIDVKNNWNWEVRTNNLLEVINQYRELH